MTVGRQPLTGMTWHVHLRMTSKILRRGFYETKNPAISCGAWFMVKGLIQSMQRAANGLTNTWLNGAFDTL
jgi:hypothetical protein